MLLAQETKFMKIERKIYEVYNQQFKFNNLLTSDVVLNAERSLLDAKAEWGKLD